MRKMRKEIVTSEMYLSEVMDKLPSDMILNKGVTGCGGTYVELHSKRDSLILVPTIELARNKSKKGFLIVYGKVKNQEIIDYLNSDIEYKKIIGTYDCLKRLLEIDEKILKYFLLVDEYHILFNSYTFRNETIQFLLKNYNKFNHFVFMTATPLDDNIILDEIKYLPQLTIKWEKAQPIKLNLIDATFTNKELIKILNNDDDDVNYHIFLNSVSTIRNIITKTGMEDYKIVCSETSKKNIRTLKVGDTLDEVKKYNFYTSTAFEGCDIFDPKGKTIILCDTNISTTILDISTLVRQICGRLRNSVYKEEITLILNTSKHRYAGIIESVFKSKVEENSRVGKYTEYKFIHDEDPEYKLKELRSFNSEMFSSFYVNKYKDEIYYDDNLRKIDEYNYKLIKEIYHSSITILKEAGNCGIDIVNKEQVLNWVTVLLQNKEYTYTELELMYSKLFFNKGLVFNGYTLKDYFPEFIKTRKIKNKIRETYYKFKL